jgi:hypothetical protein
MAFLSYTILYYHCRLLNVKTRAYDTGFGNPSNISSTIYIIIYRPLVRATWWFIGIETLLNETESQVRITLSHDYHVTCNLSANEWIDKLPIIM